MNNKKYILAAILSYSIWGMLPIFLKMLSSYDTYKIIFYRMLGAGLIFWGLVLLNYKQSWNELKTLFQNSRKNFFLMSGLSILGGILLVSNALAYLYVVNKVNVGTAVFSYLTLPILTAFLARIILNEKLSPKKWAAILLSSISCYMVASVKAEQIFYILSISGTYAFYLISQRKNLYLNRKLNLAFGFLSGGLVLYYFVPSEVLYSPHWDSYFFMVMSIIVVIFTVIPLLLNLFALSKIPSSQMSFYAYLNPIISFILSISVFHEPLETNRLLAYSLLGVSCILFNWK